MPSGFGRPALPVQPAGEGGTLGGTHRWMASLDGFAVWPEFWVGLKGQILQFQKKIRDCA